MKTIIRNSSIVNEGKITSADILIVDERIEKIDSSIELSKNNYLSHRIIDRFPEDIKMKN